MLCKDENAKKTIKNKFRDSVGKRDYVTETLKKAFLPEQSLSLAAAKAWVMYQDKIKAGRGNNYGFGIEKHDRNSRKPLSLKTRGGKQMSLSHSYSVIRDGDELYHHGVKGQRWGVVHEDELVGRKPSGKKPLIPQSGGSRFQTVTRKPSSGHAYYSPNTGNSSQYNRSSKENTSAGSNNAPSSRRADSTPDLSQNPYCQNEGVYFPIKIGNTGLGAEFNLQGGSLASIIDRKEDMAAYIKNNVISQLKSFQKNNINIHLTDKQIDMVVWKMMHEVQEWKKKYYKP